MNIMTLQRYKNEIILLLTILFALFAFIYKLSANSYVQENQTMIQKQVAEINTISNLKGQWGGKNMTNRVKTLKTLVTASKVKSFNKKAKKLIATYRNLTANDLNKVTNKLINMPVQIVTLNINKNGKNQYSMELTCKW